MLNRALFLAALVGTAFCLSPVRAADEDRAGLSDPQFVMRASADGLAEVNLARLALQQSTNADVRRFAQRMLDDHTKANQQLNAIADRALIRPAAQMDAKARQLYERLSLLRGAEFDRAYAEAMAKDHDEAVSLFEKEAKDLKNKDLKDFASKTLDTLKEHKELAHKLCDQVGGKGEGRKDRDRDKEDRSKDKNEKQR
jgi:putative membrane protein